MSLGTSFHLKYDVAFIYSRYDFKLNSSVTFEITLKSIRPKHTHTALNSKFIIYFRREISRHSSHKQQTYTSSSEYHRCLERELVCMKKNFMPFNSKQIDFLNWPELHMMNMLRTGTRCSVKWKRKASRCYAKLPKMWKTPGNGLGMGERKKYTHA